MADRVTAFVLDEDRTGTVGPLGFGAVRGEYSDEPILPEAFGMTVTELRDAISQFDLPLKEVQVAAGKANAELPRQNRLLSEPEVMLSGIAGKPERASKPSHAVTETAEGPIPVATPAATHPPLQPYAAALQARDTVLSEGGTLEEAAKAARKAGGDAGEGIAQAVETTIRAIEEADKVEWGTGTLPEQAGADVEETVDALAPHQEGDIVTKEPS